MYPWWGAERGGVGVVSSGVFGGGGGGVYTKQQEQLTRVHKGEGRRQLMVMAKRRDTDYHHPHYHY